MAKQGLFHKQYLKPHLVAAYTHGKAEIPFPN